MIAKLKAGRELDMLIAEEWMGWKIRKEIVPDVDTLDKAYREIVLYHVTDGRGTKWSPTRNLDDVGLPYWSTDISAAWEVVKKLESQGFILALLGRLVHEELADGCVVSKWRCEFMDEDAHAVGRPQNEIWRGEARAETAPLAICLAAEKIN